MVLSFKKFGIKILNIFMCLLVKVMRKVRMWYKIFVKCMKWYWKGG